MARVTGLGTSLGIAQEVTPGTAVTPTRWLDARSESLQSEKLALNGGGLRGGALYARSSNRAFIGKNVTGGWEQDVSTRGMGLLFKNCLGAGSSAVLTGTAYRQIFTPGLLSGLSLTVQKIIGSTPFTYNGYKIGDWSLAADIGAILALSVDGDGWNETTGFAAGTPSYTAAIESFNFTQGSVIVGGTASTTSGLTSVSGGTTVGIIQSVTVSGSRPLTTGDDNRRLSTTGKVEQVEDGMLEVGGSLVADFDSAFDFYSLYAADTATALSLNFTTTATPITGSTYPSINILLPDIRLMGETPKADGPGALSLDCDFIGLQDTVNGNPAVQIVTVTADSTIS